MRVIAEKIVRFAYSRFLPANARNTLSLFVLLDERDKPPTEITDFSERRVVVLAPHMDDEIAGCGGAVRKHVLAGSQVTVVYMTDGRKGDADLYKRELPRSVVEDAERTLVRRRREEASRVADIVGISEQIFLDEPDGTLGVLPATVKKVRDILRDREPSVVYLPSLMDVHPDHWMTNRIFHEAVAGFPSAAGPVPVYRGYEVWTPLLANRLADIGDVIETKKRALGEYESQVERLDYVRAILALNAYRSIYRLKGRGYAEAFHETSPDRYDRLMRRFMETR